MGFRSSPPAGSRTGEAWPRRLPSEPARLRSGRRFVAATESAAPAAYRKALGEMPAERTTITRNFSGRPARALRNRITDEVQAPLPYPAQLSLTGPLREASADTSAMWAGQAGALAREEPARAIVERIASEAEQVLARLTR